MITLRKSESEGMIMEIVLFWVEKLILVSGILLVLTGVMRYGRRSQDWKGVVTMFYKRIPMTIEEYKWYRLGVSCIVFAIILRIALLTFWPAI
ncbi:hypothetical protein D0810_04780 [Vibrio cholerae]|uniref:Uncharacterized protein n=2 Tax=Vibrio cholerae TaxID=666 RepID=A0A2A1YR76_VIBCL|nr:hypothetical protein VCG_000907 [Vibrio cholerae 12129(1)]EEO01363.1 hypothetical protein VCA_000302 [Vibrio cholerae VL426]EEO05081.1 hypothetical protein VIF_003424 [Vibrio cholerae TM 11079-80]EFH74166.1 conserved hypothetical protein [Vibrio cholerae RC385]EGQ8140481.1 hypothetical protein [Vibrio cholerae]KNA48436.1 hypothetical protein A5A_023532 [Vibrio cholerae MZO-2]KNA60786.1 hypothetical protein VCV51_032048 [Vibrio cholerae V51]RBM61198.1 hypothetical protein DLR71_12945 [Vibr